MITFLRLRKIPRTPTNVGLVLKREHDGADHGHEQNDAGSLEEINVVRVKNEPDRLRVGNFVRRRYRRGDRPGDVRHDGVGADNREELDQTHGADQSADRQMGQHAPA